MIKNKNKNHNDYAALKEMYKKSKKTLLEFDKQRYAYSLVCHFIDKQEDKK
jgi:hypothetical protein